MHVYVCLLFCSLWELAKPIVLFILQYIITLSLLIIFFLLQLIKFITSLTNREKAIVFVGRKSMVDFLSVEMLEAGLHVSRAVF